MCANRTNGKLVTRPMHGSGRSAASTWCAPSCPLGPKIVCVCRSGARSAKATELLRSWGLDAVNLEGGMQAWAAEGRPVERDDGSPGTVI